MGDKKRRPTGENKLRADIIRETLSYLLQIEGGDLEDKTIEELKAIHESTKTLYKQIKGHNPPEASNRISGLE